MKTLLLIRHAKSDWEDPSLQDFDRPLNERGKRDAPAMAQRLLDKDIAIDAFISSPAKRAKKTAGIFANAYGIDKEAILFFDELYLAPPSVFYNVISRTDNTLNHIAVFAHNPGISDFANELTNARVDDLPTCGIFAVSAETDDWATFSTATKNFLFCDFPKSR